MRTIEVDREDHERVAAFKKGAIDYARNLPEWAHQELYRKPFCTFTEGVEPVVLVYFRDVANLLELLDLPAGAAILDVACGPGWLSEALFRFGYRVTGVDIAGDLLEVARERIRSLPSPPIQRDRTWIEFLALDIEAARLERRFDAVVLYDCLHHFVDAESALVNVRSMLSRNGVLVIKEGAMPAPGSAGERELLAESEAFTTLEAPFDPEALAALLGRVGFRDVRRFVPGAALLPARESLVARVRRAFGAPPGPPVNFFVARLEPGPSEAAAPATARWAAELELLGAAPQADAFAVEVRVANAGRAVWTAGGEDRVGTVCLGCRLDDAEGGRLDEYHGRTPLPRDLGPGESLEVTLRYPWHEAARDGGRLTVDVVRQGQFWFGDQGSPVLVLDLPRRG